MDTNRNAERESQAERLCNALNKVYSLLDCQRALRVSNDDPYHTAEWLTDGGMPSPSSNWSEKFTKEVAGMLSRETQQPLDRCMTVLRQCRGSLELSRRKLTGASATPTWALGYV